MLTGSCHCGAVRFTSSVVPDWVTQCTCSVCRKLGALWIHGPRAQFVIDHAEDAVIRYVWGDKTLAFVSCKTCGCTTHWVGIDPDSPHDRMAVNARLCDPKAIAGIRVRTFDGADSWAFLD